MFENTCCIFSVLLPAAYRGAPGPGRVVCVPWRRAFPAPRGGPPRIVVPRAARGPRARRAAANLENRILRSMRSTSDSRLAKLEQRFKHERRFGPKRIQISEPGRAGPRGTPNTFFEMHLQEEPPSGGTEPRVRSWLRMNAGGAPNTCKSNGRSALGRRGSGERLSNTWATCPSHRDSLGKPWVIPDDPAPPHGGAGEAQTARDGPAAC